jgi:hypothetical protein
MVPRSFITNVRSGDQVPTYPPLWLRGIAFGGDCGVAHVEVSIDGGTNWLPAGLGKDEGKYSFRQWETEVRLPSAGRHTVMVRCINSKDETQPTAPNWNPAGFMRNVIESINVVAVSGE